MPFPTTGILDTFVRANEGPPPSASWAGIILPSDGGLKIVSNACVGDSALFFNSSAWGQTFGPDCEVFVTMTALAAVGGFCTIFTRLIELNTAFVDGYAAQVEVTASGVASWSMFRIDDAVGTALAFTDAPINAGDTFGMASIGSSHYVCRKPSGGEWESALSVSDSTYPNTGYIGAR